MLINSMRYQSVDSLHASPKSVKIRGEGGLANYLLVQTNHG